MPRYDRPLREKVDSFRELSGEKPALSVDEKESSRSSLVDFSFYLREPKYTFDDVILPENTKKQLHAVLAEIEHQDLIYNHWGMAEKHKFDKALSISFSGASGTGKTLSAEALAHALNLKICVVPYDKLESKFVGETPKNIVSAFEFATEQNALLFFDEADSFLGKRLETVTQATDTAVNLTRNVMMLQLSQYEGIVVFATNLIRNYDSAFISRMRWKIQFDLPDENARTAIWKAQIPSKLPLDSDVDFPKLAAEVENISGRDIKNSVFKAVVSAAKEDKPNSEKKVTHSHFKDGINEVVESNKNCQQQELKLVPVDKAVELPPLPEINHTEQPK